VPKIEITQLKNGQYLLNGKPYKELQGPEKYFFDKFLIETVIIFKKENKIV
jgi:hypothetical protein